MDADMTVGNDMNLGIDITLEGDGELNVDFDTGMDFSYSIDSQAEWRLGNPSPIYARCRQRQHVLGMRLESDSVGVEDAGGDAEVYDMCGMIDLFYIGGRLQRLPHRSANGRVWLRCWSV